MKDFKTYAKKVRGLGSAKAGVHHWIQQKFTAVTNIAVVLWLVTLMVQFSDFDYGAMLAYMQSPVNSIFAILFSVSVFYHAKLGLQVVIEDYVPSHSTRTITLLLMNAFVFAAMFVVLFAILKVAL
ncbi:MAG: succinate dehydrogenase, hydrophobic membrane anchor protein [Pseudomonadota bacterium]